MRILLAVIVLLSFHAVPAQRSGEKRQAQAVGQQVLTAEDFKKREASFDRDIKETTFLVQIHRKLPPYKIRLIPDLTVKDAEGRDTVLHHVGWIEISRSNSSFIAQLIEVQTHAWLVMFTNRFEALDINFDGYLDLAVLNDYGAKWAKYKYWLYDPGSGRFITNSLTRSLGRLTSNEIEMNPETKEIKLGRYEGVCPQSKTYRILKRGVVITEVEERECETDGAKVRIKRRINGKLRLVSTQFEKW